jgi:hypothetical protein
MDSIFSIVAAWFVTSVVAAIGFALGAAVGYRRGCEEGREVEPERVVRLDDPAVRRRATVMRGR